MNPIQYDPLSGGDPYPIYAAMRRQAPLYCGAGGWYALSRHEDVRAALRRPADFSSAAMHELVMAVGDDEPGEQPRTLIGTDPPDHTTLRKIVNRGFVRRRIAQLEPRIRQMARERIAPIVARGGGDLVADLAAAVPVMVIAEMLGIDAERRHDFRRWSDDLVAVLGGRATPDEVERSRDSLDELGDYLDFIIADRQRQPRGDLISALIGAHHVDGVLTEDETRFFAELLLIAGNETTTYLIANALHALLSHPDQLELVTARPERIPHAIEETLRWNSPVQVTMRRATRDLETPHGRIPGGANVLLLLASANRDESVFSRASHFDLTRDASAHLAFGLGTHFCLGSALARLEARVVLEELFAAADLQLLGPGVFRHTLLLRGVERLSVGATARCGSFAAARKIA